MQPSTIVTLKDVNAIFNKTSILQRINFELRRGEITTLVGPNGAGKSTLVKIILGLIPQTSGTITYYGKPRIGYIPQRLTISKVLPLTVARFLGLSRYCSTKQQLTDKLALLNITSLASQQITTLSGGELQKVLLARALLSEPQLLILDEPAQGMDATAQVKLYGLINQLTKQLNCAIFLVSHDLYLVMASSHQVICLNRHICCQGKPEIVANNTQFAKLFGQFSQEQLALYAHHNHPNSSEHN